LNALHNCTKGLGTAAEALFFAVAFQSLMWTILLLAAMLLT